jgi:hypothetical protein
METGVVAVHYDRIYALTSTIQGAALLLETAQRNISDLESDIQRPLYGR